MPCILLRDRFCAVTLTLGEPFRELAEALIREDPIPPCDPYLKSIGYGLFLHQYSCIPRVTIDRDFNDSQFLLMQAMGLAMRTDFRSVDAVLFAQNLYYSLDLGEEVTADLQTLVHYLSSGNSYHAFQQKVPNPVMQGIFIFLYALFDQSTAMRLSENAPLQKLVTQSLGSASLGWQATHKIAPELVSLADRLFRAWQGVWEQVLL